MNSLRVGVRNFLLVLSVCSLIVACGGEEDNKKLNPDNYLHQGSERMQKFIEKTKRDREAKGNPVESSAKDKHHVMLHNSPSFLAPLI